MKLLITGDWHLDTQRPENRTDDYFQTQFEKVKWIFNFAKQHRCEAILQPGDMFNSHKANDFLKQHYINFFLKYDIGFYTIFGQHDLRFHSSDKQNTPLMVMSAANTLTILSNEKPLDVESCYLYAVHWGDEIPEPVDEEGVHILLMHKLVIQDAIGWEKNFLSVDNVFRFSKHDIIVCGDNHQSFMRHNGNRLLFNCGSLMRNRIDQGNHDPVVYIVDTSDMSWSQHHIPVRPFHDVMDVSKAEKRKERNVELESFVDKLGGDFEISGLDFKRNVMSYCKENEIDQDTIDFIEEVMA